MAVLKTEKALAKFNKKLQELFEKFGVVATPNSYAPYELVTETGTLLITPRNKADRTSGWWIFTRMDEGWDKEELLKRAGIYSGINEYSGKWNVMGHTAETALERIESQLVILTKDI